MRVIFLDIDGVLNYEGGKEFFSDGSHFVDDNKLKILREMVDDTGAELVLSSSWRRGWNLPVNNDHMNRKGTMEGSDAYFMLCAKLHDFGMSFVSEIPRIENGTREDAILYWLNEWPGEAVTDYVILDDEADKFSTDNTHLIVTSIKEGLMPEHICEARKILNLEDEPGFRKKILIVDDIEVNREMLKANLVEDYDIYEAEDGRAALAFLQENRDIDLLITDIKMPELDGLDLIRRIRAQSIYNHISIIANTQYGDPDQEEELLDAGADDFVYKPSSPKIMKFRVRKALDKH